jgi:hypothetical protein
MGRQIRFFLCETMRAAIDAEALSIGAKLGTHADTDAIQFSTSNGTDRQQGRLWVSAGGVSQYNALCRVVKKNSVYDKESGLWVKKESLEIFGAYREAEKKMLDELVARNRKYATEVLGGRPAAGDG